MKLFVFYTIVALVAAATCLRTLFDLLLPSLNLLRGELSVRFVFFKMLYSITTHVQKTRASVSLLLPEKSPG